MLVEGSSASVCVWVGGCGVVVPVCDCFLKSFVDPSLDVAFARNIVNYI